MTLNSDDYLKSALKSGLSAKAGSVYVTLLEAQTPLSPKALIMKTRLHRQYVYDALEELSLQGLVVKNGEKKRVTYLAGSPDRLLQEAEKQRIDTEDGVSALMRLYDQSPAGIVEVIRGSRAVVDAELTQMENAPSGSSLDIIGGAGMHWVELFGEKVSVWEKIRKEKNIKLRYIGCGEDVRYNKEESPIHHESRLIPNIGDIVNVAIREDSVSFNIYEPEVVIVRVKSPEAVKSQRALFEVLWKVAT